MPLLSTNFLNVRVKVVELISVFRKIVSLVTTFSYYFLKTNFTRHKIRQIKSRHCTYRVYFIIRAISHLHLFSHSTVYYIAYFAFFGRCAIHSCKEIEHQLTCWLLSSFVATNRQQQKQGNLRGTYCFSPDSSRSCTNSHTQFVLQWRFPSPFYPSTFTQRFILFLRVYQWPHPLQNSPKHYRNYSHLLILQDQRGSHNANIPEARIITRIADIEFKRIAINLPYPFVFLCRRNSRNKFIGRCRMVERKRSRCSRRESLLSRRTDQEEYKQPAVRMLIELSSRSISWQVSRVCFVHPRA